MTKKDSHPLPRICETLDSLIGAAYFSTFDLTSGFWQVPMAEESKQFTAFTLGSMGLFECDRMPFGLCNAPATFQRLMQNCLGELNLTYCLIYLDDVIVYSKTPEEHLQRMRVMFDCLHEHGLKLKPTKCDLFRTELIYLAHHVSKDGFKPSKKRDGLILRNGMLYHKTHLTKTGEDLWHFIVPKSHGGVALDGCHREAAHQGQCCSISLMQEWFWWPGMTQDITNKVKNCACCKKYEGAPPIAKLQKLPCSGPRELLHIDFTMIEETVGLHEEPVIRNVLIMQDHFSKHVVAYVVKDQKARTAAEALCSRYFGFFGAPAYLLSDKGKSFTAMVVEDLCTLYCVKKLRTSSYHARTNGQVECMNQTLIRLIGKLDEDKKACWSNHLPELLMAYNSIRSAVTGYSPHFLLSGRRLRIPVDYLFPTLRDTPHKSKLKESVALHQKRLKEAFAMVRQLTSEEAVGQQCHYNHRAGAITLQPWDVVMVCTDRFVGKRKVKDQREEGGYMIVDQLEDWPVYKVKCPPSENKHKAKYLTLHRNHLMLVPPGDNTPQVPAQLKVTVAIVLNANIGTILYDGESDCSNSGMSLPSLLT